MIEVKDVVKTFDGFRALDGVTMTVPRGAVYGLVGPNGAGKSTLIRHLTGIYRPDSGAIDIDGQPVYENPAVKARIAYIPDDVFYFPQATIPDMMRYYRGIYPKFDAERYQKLGEVFQLDPKRQIRRLSKGMQKQAAFWLAMSLRPDVLILDEPVDGLDPVMRRQVWNLVLADVAENGTTVLISSHNLRELEDVCDHVGIMNGGKVLLEHPAGQHRQGARRPAGRGEAARGARHPAPEQSGPPVHADRARRRRRGHEPPVHRAAAVPRRGAADARRDLYL